MNGNQLKYLSLGARTVGLFVGFVALQGVEPAHAASAASKSAMKRVAVFQYADTPLHQRGVAGMIEGLKSKGFVDGENINLTSHSALQNTETAGKIAQEIAEGAFDLVLTSGTQALQAMAQANQDGKTVQVFGIVANPFKAGVGLNAKDPMDHPGHLVGVASFPPVEEVFDLAKRLNPGLEVVGVVYNPAETNASEGVERARKKSSELGIELLEARASTPSEVSEQARALVKKGAQMLWIGADNTVHHAADAVIAAAVDGGIPVMSSLPGDAERGAMADLTHDWHEVGKKVGTMAGDILAGTDPSTIEIVVHDDHLLLVLNETALTRLKAPWSFPEEVAERANKVIKSAE